MAGLTREIVDIEHYVARYARDGLKVEEREAFEEYVLMHPDLAEQVATDRVMLSGMQALEKQDSESDSGSWSRYAMAAGIAVLAIFVGIWGFIRFGAPAPSALYALADTLPTRLESKLSEPLRVALQRGAPITLEQLPGHDAMRLDVVLDGAAAAQVYDVALIEYTQQGEIVRGHVTQAARTVDEERILPVVVDLAAVEGRRLRLDVKSDASRLSFELRVVRP